MFLREIRICCKPNQWLTKQLVTYKYRRTIGSAVRVVNTCWWPLIIVIRITRDGLSRISNVQAVHSLVFSDVYRQHVRFKWPQRDLSSFSEIATTGRFHNFTILEALIQTQANSAPNRSFFLRFLDYFRSPWSIIFTKPSLSLTGTSNMADYTFLNVCMAQSSGKRVSLPE